MSVPRPPARLAIVLTPFARPEVVAAACAQLGMSDAVAVPSKSGVVVTRPLPPKAVHDDWDIAELFGEAPSAPAHGSQDAPLRADADAPVPPDVAGTGAGTTSRADADAQAGAGAGAAPGPSPDADAPTAGGAVPGTFPDADASPRAGSAPRGVDDADTAAATGADAGRAAPSDAPEAPAGPSADAGEELATAMSTITRRGVVLVTADLGVDTGVETGLAGHVTAREWAAGAPGKEVPPGLLLANADEVVEDIVLGRRAPDEIAGAIRAADVTGRGPKRRLFGRGQ